VAEHISPGVLTSYPQRASAQFQSSQSLSAATGCAFPMQCDPSSPRMVLRRVTLDETSMQRPEPVADEANGMEEDVIEVVTFSAARRSEDNDDASLAAQTHAKDLRMEQMQSQIAELQARLDALSEHDGKTEGRGEDIKSLEDLDADSANREFIPKVREVRWEEFKNRFGPGTRSYAVDVLLAGPLLEQEMFQEMQNRQPSLRRRGSKKAKPSEMHAVEDGGGGAITVVDKAMQNAGSEDVWMQRVRINSPTLLAILSRHEKETWSMLPRTFFRPFRNFIHFYDELRQNLEELESKWGDSESTTPGEPTGSIADRADGADGRTLRTRIEDTFTSIDDCPTALRELRCLVRFIEDKILPLRDGYLRPGSEGLKQKIHFDDLFYLFKPGEIIFHPSKDDADHHRRSSPTQSVWRVVGVRCPLPRFKYHNTNNIRVTRNASGSDWESQNFVVECYYIDFNGDEYCPVSKMFQIQPFENERQISHLPVYPFSYVEKSEEMLDLHRNQGEHFTDLAKVRHFSYNWRTLVSSPLGEVVTDTEGVVHRHALHINSDVIVDPVEAFQVCASWKPVAAVFRKLDEELVTTADDVLVYEWSGRDRAKVLSREPGILSLMGSIPVWERNKCLDTDPFLSAVRDRHGNGKRVSDEDLDDMDLCLLPTRTFAYVLKDRRFFQLDTRKLRPVVASETAFRSLKINMEHKRMIQALIQSHFRNRANERRFGVEGRSQDLISGKGRGLVFLLHGKPGVGKSATAEAVAQACKKPIFSISSGDLGTKPREVEMSLQAIFRMASMWDAILLFDEVDTFFSQRNEAGSSVTKGALTAIFLGVLERYPGILFLTTNRIGALDEAFKSRVQVSIYYPPLGEHQTMEIWKMNIDRLREIEMEKSRVTGEEPLEIDEEEILAFALAHFRSHKEGKGRWNGRQIRTAFQIASSLTRYDALEGQANGNANPYRPRPKLGVAHFRTMSLLTREFDDYIVETLGKTHEDMAWESSARADHVTSPSQLSVPQDTRDDYGLNGPGRRRASSNAYAVTSPPPSDTVLKYSDFSGESSLPPTPYRGGQDLDINTRFENASAALPRSPVPEPYFQNSGYSGRSTNVQERPQQGLLRRDASNISLHHSVVSPCLPDQDSYTGDRQDDGFRAMDTSSRRTRREQYSPP
jgi:hypothetical protein